MLTMQSDVQIAQTSFRCVRFWAAAEAFEDRPEAVLLEWRVDLGLASWPTRSYRNR